MLTLDDVAAELRIGPSTVRRAVQSGQLEAVRLGENGPLRVPRDSVERWLRPAAPTDPKEAQRDEA